MKPSTILFYAPFNQHSRDTESLMIAFHQQGHKVIFLTQLEGNEINDFLRTKGVTAYSHVLAGRRGGLWYFTRHLFFFVHFCWKHRINVVYSHLEPANFVASIGQYFIRARTYLCRHHVNEGQLSGFDRKLDYRITYKLAKQIIVVSSQARKYMIEKEGIPARKILHINLAYDFDLYGKVNEQVSRKIKEESRTDILLLAAFRFASYKRADLVIRLVQKLLERRVNVKLILLGSGDLADDMKALVAQLGLQDYVTLPGYVSNILDYMAAADFFIHPSVSESSCVVIKEAGLVKLPVIVCQGIGDFDDYVVHEHNGFLLDPERFIDEATQIVSHYGKERQLLANIGAALRDSVLERFSLENVIEQYGPLNLSR